MIIYGAGGFGREVAWLAEDIGCQPVCFADDALDFRGEASRSGLTETPQINDLPVLTLNEAVHRYPAAEYAIGVGSPVSRRRMVQRAEELGLKPGSLVHSSVRHSRWLSIAEGVVICAGTTLTTNISLERHVQINLHCTIGHDVVIGEFASLAPGVHVSGWVHIGKDVYIGTGTAIINGTSSKPLRIGDGAIIGAGACVVNDIPPGITVMGVPAKPRHAI